MLDFIQEQVLGMKWLNTLIGNMLSLFGIDISDKIGGSIHFFIYDVIKIVILLCVLIFIISYIQSYFPPERTKKDSWKISWNWSKPDRSVTWNCNTFLFLLINSTIYRFYKRRFTTWSNIQLSYIITNGGFRFVGIVDKYLWSEGSSDLCNAWFSDCCCRGYAY